MYDAAQREALIEIAERAIRHATTTGEVPEVDPSTLGAWAEEPRATFVTVYLDGKLHGCIGTLTPRRPLAEDIANNACRAALEDPRFPPLRNDQVDATHVHLAVLGPLVAMVIADEEDLINKLRVGRDGLLIDDGDRHRATFLPAVWKKVRDPGDFLLFLKRKAGLRPNEWPESMKAFRYEVEEFDRETLTD